MVSQFVALLTYSRPPLKCGGKMCISTLKIIWGKSYLFLCADRQANDTLSNLKTVLSIILMGKNNWNFSIE